MPATGILIVVLFKVAFGIQIVHAADTEPTAAAPGRVLAAVILYHFDQCEHDRAACGDERGGPAHGGGFHHSNEAAQLEPFFNKKAALNSQQKIKFHDW